MATSPTTEFVIDKPPTPCITMLGFIISLPLVMFKGLRTMVLLWAGKPVIGARTPPTDTYFGPWFPFRLRRAPVVVADAAAVDAILSHIKAGMKIGFDMEYEP
ncbi:hypothetical protein R3P38DRAFT_3224406 [Favolaschia claudopus]|uniref:Uncharacterized protein n=1 Tax=Favolaschia claudopus TaxID=2862362 RepID=A0AAV9ZVW1_9AGAR